MNIYSKRIDGEDCEYRVKKVTKNLVILEKRNIRWSWEDGEEILAWIVDE